MLPFLQLIFALEIIIAAAKLAHADAVIERLPQTLIVIGTVQTASAIALESTLSFLGVGLRQTEPSLGVLISNGFEYMRSGRYWISFFPGVALLLTIVSINLVGDHDNRALALMAVGKPEHMALVKDWLHTQKWASPDFDIRLDSGGLVVWRASGGGVRHLD